MQHQELYDGIQALNLSEGPMADFQARLAREQRWSKAFAAHAIVEYRRFLYLAAISPEPVTPSKIIDEVWHLHLLHTRSYWDEFCGQLLGRPIHHEPGSGRKEDGRTFARQYAGTLGVYEKEFGSNAPAPFWPQERKSTRQVRLLRARLAGICLMLASPALLGATGYEIDWELVKLGGAISVGFVIVYCIYQLVKRWQQSMGNCRGGGAGCGYTGSCESSGGHHGENDYGSCGGSGGDSGGSGCGGGGCGGGGD